MRMVLILLTFVSCLPAFGQPDSQKQVDALIRKLSSTSFAEREAATKLLKERPEAAKALHNALHSKDTETRKRVAEILEYLERAPIRALDLCVKEGRAEDFISQLATWPQGKYEVEAWAAVREFVRILADLDQQHARNKTPQSGKRERLVLLTDSWKSFIPDPITIDRVSESTKANIRRSYFVRAGEVDIDPRRAKGANDFSFGAVFVVARNLSLHTDRPQLIFAGGNVELRDSSGVPGTLILSAGDVVINCELAESMIICRGKVQCNARVGNCRIISGKTISCNRDPVNCLFTENEPCPLGYVQWSTRAGAKQPSK